MKFNRIIMMHKWEKSENLTAKIYGKKVPGSGSGESKLDIIGLGAFEGLRCENKFTEAKSRSIKLEAELLKAKRQALKHNCNWFFILDFDLEHRFAIVDESYFISLHSELEMLYNTVERLEREIG